MSGRKTNNIIKRIVDAAMTVFLLFLMAYQVTGEMAHEWIGMGMAPVSFARRMHLSMSHWAFVLMGLHLGMHIPVMTGGMKLKDKTRALLVCAFICISGIGLWLFLRNNMPDYLFFRVPFAFLDYEKAGWLVFLENLLMLFSFLCGIAVNLVL